MQMGFIRISADPIRLINLDLIQTITYDQGKATITFQEDIMVIEGEEAKTLMSAMEFFMHPKVNSR